MKMVAMAATVAVLMTGCGGLQIDQSKVVPAPRASDATIAQVMADWNMTSTPQVFWYGSAALDCDGTGYKSSANGKCVGGEQEDGQIIVSLTGDPDADTLSDLDLMYLVHEMQHESSDQHGGGGCSDHRCDGFRYSDGRELLLPWHDPVYYGGDVDVETAKLSSSP